MALPVADAAATDANAAPEHHRLDGDVQAPGPFGHVLPQCREGQGRGQPDAAAEDDLDVVHG
ncbi:hypothetical protein [Kineosporia succinea]